MRMTVSPSIISFSWTMIFFNQRVDQFLIQLRNIGIRGDQSGEILYALRETMPVFLAGCMTGMAQSPAAVSPQLVKEPVKDSINWDFVGG